MSLLNFVWMSLWYLGIGRLLAPSQAARPDCELAWKVAVRSGARHCAYIVCLKIDCLLCCLLAAGVQQTYARLNVTDAACLALCKQKLTDS